MLPSFIHSIFIFHSFDFPFTNFEIRGFLFTKIQQYDVMLSFIFSGKITFHTIPPERKTDENHESVSVVQYWGAEFDLVIHFILMSL